MGDKKILICVSSTYINKEFSNFFQHYVNTSIVKKNELIMRIKYIMQVYNDSNLKLSAFMMQKNTYMCVLRTAKSFCQRRFFLNVSFVHVFITFARMSLSSSSRHKK